jgi:hypothetical protein
MPRAPRRPGTSAPQLSDLPAIHKQVWQLRHQTEALLQTVNRPGHDLAEIDTVSDLSRELHNAEDSLHEACRLLDRLTPYSK